MSGRTVAVVRIGLVASLFVGLARADPPSPATPAAGPPGREAPAPSPPFVQPDTGTLVEFDSDRPLVSVFVAPGLLDETGPSYPDPFFKLGRTPLATKLAPGTYTVTAESPDITNGSTVFQVGTQPVHVRIRSGSSDMRTTGTLLLATGIVGLIAAILVEATYSPTLPNDIAKSKIAVPVWCRNTDRRRLSSCRMIR